MIKNKRNPFDIPVEGISEHYFTMPELMKCYDSFIASRDYENAKSVLDYAIQSGYLPAKVIMARFLKNTPNLSMTQQERYTLSEKLYREVLNILDLPDRVVASLSMELAELYEILNRPVACLGAMLRAKRLGYAVQEKEIDLCRCKLNRMDIHSFCDNPQDCYDLGSELALADSFKFAELFLRESLSSPNKELVGSSCLMLADLYNERCAESSVYREEAAKMYQEAKEKGFPEYLVKRSEDAAKK